MTMSYNFHIYSPGEQPVLKEELKAELERQGWPIAFCSGGGDIENIVSSEGLIENDAFIVTCEPDGVNIYRFRKAVESKDIKALNEMLNKEGIGGVDFCGICWKPFDFNRDYGPEVLEANRKFYPAGFATALQQARTEYSLEGSFGEFYLFVAQAIGGLVGGMFEDSLQGTIEFITARN